MATLREVAEVVAFLATLHPERQVTPDTMRAYHLVLYDLDPDVLKAAALQLSATSRWFPKPEELRKEAARISSGCQLSTGEEAWAEVVRQIRLVGYIGHPEWSDTRIQEAVDAIGGWRAICTSDNTVADRAHFMRIYDRLYERDVLTETSHPAVIELTVEIAGRLADFANTRLSLPDSFRKPPGEPPD